MGKPPDVSSEGCNPALWARVPCQIFDLLRGLAALAVHRVATVRLGLPPTGVVDERERGAGALVGAQLGCPLTLPPRVVLVALGDLLVELADGAVAGHDDPLAQRLDVDLALAQDLLRELEGATPHHQAGAVLPVVGDALDPRRLADGLDRLVDPLARGEQEPAVGGGEFPKDEACDVLDAGVLFAHLLDEERGEFDLGVELLLEVGLCVEHVLAGLEETQLGLLLLDQFNRVPLIGGWILTGTSQSLNGWIATKQCVGIIALYTLYVNSITGVRYCLCLFYAKEGAVLQ